MNGVPDSRLARTLLLIAVIAGVAIPIDLALHARAVTGALGFPLDAAWIHLTFARTLAEHGQFRFFPGDTAAAGPTSPLFMLLEAALFRVVRNERLLGIALGIACHAAFLAAFAAWARRRLGSAAWAAAAVLLVALDQRLAILAASGMETSLFLLAIALAFHERLAGRMQNAAIALGAAVWVRPDGLILAAVFALDALLPAEPASRKRKAAAPAPAFLTPQVLLTFAAILAAYAAYQWNAGSALLPGTAAARMATYRHGDRFDFLAEDVAQTFLTVGWIPLLPLLLYAIGREAWRLARRQPGETRLEAGWITALTLGYLLLLPDGGRFQRYLAPAIPAAVVMSLALLRSLLAHPRLAPLAKPFRLPGARRGALILALVVVAALATFAIPTTAREYAGAVRYTRERHEVTGRWIAANTAPAAVIAAHDIGAIGFHSRRRIVDTAGHLDREILPAIGTPNYPRLLEQLFTRRGVTHVAALEEWLPVDNIPPVFVANRPPEVMRVFEWRPGRSHIVLGSAWREAAFASQAIARGDYEVAVAALDRGLRADRASSQLWFLLGVALGNADRPDEAERAFRNALRLYPGWPEAQDGLASALEGQGRPWEVPEAIAATSDTTRR